ncbi:hypothetical protein BHE74_00029026 [Ensete ventricosum]|nr:hypothetical protein BHE74_00029026 [Ensete ventricosum]
MIIIILFWRRPLVGVLRYLERTLAIATRLGFGTSLAHVSVVPCGGFGPLFPEARQVGIRPLGWRILASPWCRTRPRLLSVADAHSKSRHGGDQTRDEEYAFADASNLEHCAKYLNQTLVTFGFPASLDLFATDPVDAYEVKKQELMAENSDLRALLRSMQDVFDLPFHMARDQIEESLRTKMSSIKASIMSKHFAKNDKPR